jgi:protein-S-isoprenylcysteine O-methyltransferase Ste14
MKPQFSGFGSPEGLMSNEQAGVGGYSGRGAHWLAALASLIIGTSFFALWFWLLPPWLGFHVDLASVARWQWPGAAYSVLGFSVAFRCVWDFGWTGHGTPAPFAPPQKLVVVGFYRYVRNPMYAGFFSGWLGLWAVFGRASLPALVIALVVVLAVGLFVRFYEEPTLRKMFGADYEVYCSNVSRWIPQLRPWKQ